MEKSGWRWECVSTYISKRGERIKKSIATPISIFQPSFPIRPSNRPGIGYGDGNSFSQPKMRKEIKIERKNQTYYLSQQEIRLSQPTSKKTYGRFFENK